MAFALTGMLGTSNSFLGNVVLGAYVVNAPPTFQVAVTWSTSSAVSATWSV